MNEYGICAECGNGFADLDDWWGRHSRNEDDADVHDECCPDCKADFEAMGLDYKEWLNENR